MGKIGKLFEANEYYLSELIMSGEILKGVMNELEPLLANVEKEASTADVVVIGTVKDDIHDIGKNIVVTLLKGTGFDVIDLGVDVPAETFVKQLKKQAPGYRPQRPAQLPSRHEGGCDQLAAAGLRPG